MSSRVSISIFCGFTLVSCALSPTTEQVSEFGKAATNVIDDFQGAEKLHAELVVGRDIDVRAQSYLTGNTPELPGLPKPKTVHVYTEKMQFIDALADYFDALSKATDPAAMTKLENAADGFAGAMSSFAGTVATIGGAPAPSGLAVVGPAMQLVSFVGVNLYEYELRNRVHKIIEGMDPVVVQGTEKLIKDIEAQKRLLRNDYHRWRTARGDVLAALRRSDATSYAAFVASDAQAKAYRDRLSVLDDAGTDLALLIRTHRAMLSGDDAQITAGILLLGELARRTKPVLVAIK